LKEAIEDTDTKSADGTTTVRKKAQKKAEKKAKGAELTLTVLDDARESGKPIMLFFSAPGKDTALGKQCLTFENFVLRNQKIFDQAQKFHRVKIDPTKFKREVLKKYKVKVAPTVVFLSYDGSIITKIQGKSKPAQFLNTLKAVLAKNLKLAKKAGKTIS
jgi:thiol:disulfide interchange protein